MSIHKKTVGILGGGQLARMLVLKAHQMGLNTLVLADKATDPAVRICSRWIKGDIHSAKDIRLMLRLSDVVTFESEFISANLLKKCMQDIPRNRTRIYPDLNCLWHLQDRLLQKEWLYDFDLPTLEHVKIGSRDEMDLAYEAFNHKLVFKKRLGGYDGYGTFVVRNQPELRAFRKSIKGEEMNYIIEPFANFKSERSIIFARSSTGQQVSLPMIQSVQTNNQCDYVMGPVRHPAENRLREKIGRFLNEINYVGVIAFELFDLGSELVINEIAPRVHNTGHFSQDALNVDQFELHLRCVLGMDLPEIRLRYPAFVMVNLLGQSARTPQIKKFPTGSFHWYDKEDNRPKRKMGHINYVGRSKSTLLKTALTERKGILI